MLFFNIVCLFYVTVLIDSHPISKTIARFKKVDDTVDSITDLDYSREEQRRNDIFHENLRHKCKREDFDPMKTNELTHATENNTIKITLPETVVQHGQTKKRKSNYFWQNFKTHKRIHKPKKEAKRLKTKNKTSNATIYEYKYDPMISDSESMRDEQKATVRFNRQIPKHSYEAFNQTNQMFPIKITTTTKPINEHITTKAISETTDDNLRKSLDEITKKVTELKLKYSTNKIMTTKNSTKATEQKTTTNKATVPASKPSTTSKSSMIKSPKSTLTDSWNDPPEDILGIQQIEVLLNNLKSRAFGLMTEQSPSVSELVYNVATETTFEVDPLLNHLQVTKPMHFTTLLIGTKNSNYKRNTQKLTTPSMRSARDLGNEDSKLMLLMESSSPSETSSPYESTTPFETTALFQASTPPKSTFSDKILGQTNQIPTNPGISMLQNVENMLHKELLDIYKKLKNMLYENREKKVENLIEKSPFNQTLSTKPAITTAVAKTRNDIKIGTNQTKSVYSDAMIREYRSFLNQSLPLSVYEALLNKIQKDNVMTMLSTAENFFLMPNVSEYLFTLPETQDRAKRFTGDPETTTESYSPSNSNEMLNTEERKEYTNLSELKTDLSYNNFVNGYKYYLDYQKERGQDRFSNQIKFQAHKHHKVDDIGKYILNKIPPMRNTRNIFDDSDMEYPDISTKSDDSWFKRHFYVHIESGPPKKYHTAEAVTLKPATVKKTANFNVESKPMDHAVGDEDTEEPYRANLRDETTKYDMMDLLTGVNVSQLKLDNKYLHGYETTTPKYDRKFVKNYKFDLKDDKNKKLDKDADQNYTFDYYIKPDKYKNSDVTFQYNYDGGKKYQTTFQVPKLQGNLEENEGFVIKFIYDRNNATTESKKKCKKKNRKKSTKLHKFKNYFETDLNDKVKRDLEDYYIAKDTDIRDARDDNILSTKAIKSGKNDGYVNLDLLPQSTAVVNLYNSQKKPNKIRKFFRKYNFFKRKKFDNPKSKRDLNKLEKLNPFLKIKHMFNKPFEKVITSQSDYDLINSHIDTFKPIKYSRLPNMDELKVQVPNISILTEEAIHIAETTTNKGRYIKPIEGRKLKVKIPIHPYMLPRPKANEDSRSTNDANDLLYYIYTNKHFKNQRSTTFNKMIDDNVININVLKDKKTTELIGDPRKHANELNRKHFGNEIGKNNVAHNANAARDHLEQRSYKFNELTEPAAGEEPATFTEETFIKKYSSPKLRKHNTKKRKSHPHTIPLNNKNIRLNSDSDVPKNKMIYDYFNDLMLWHSDILNFETTPKYSTSNKNEAYEDVTYPVNLKKREQPNANYAFKYPAEVEFVRNQPTFTFNSENTQDTGSPDDEGIRWKRFFEKNFYVPSKTTRSYSRVKNSASTKSKKKTSKVLPPVTVYKKPEQTFNTPLPMDFEEFDHFLKTHRIDVESVTSPLHQMTTLSDTWESKTKTDTMNYMKTINKTTPFVNTKLTNKSAIFGYADFGDSELYSSYPEEQIEYLNEQLEYMEKELNDDEELVRRKRARKAKNVTSDITNIANSNLSLAQIEEMLAEKKNGRVHALFKKLNHTMEQSPHLTSKTTAFVELNSSELGAEWKTKYLNDIKKKLNKDVEQLSDKFIGDGAQQPILKISGHGYHYHLWLGPSENNLTTTTTGNTDEEFIKSFSTKTYLSPTKTTKIKDFGLSTYNTHTLTVSRVPSTVENIHSSIESLEKSLGATKQNNLSGLFHLFSNKRRQSRSVFKFSTKAPNNSSPEEAKRNDKEILSILIEKYPKRKHAAESTTTSMDLIPHDFMLRDKTNNLYITYLPFPTVGDQFGPGMLDTMKDEKISVIEANEFLSTPAISKLKKRSAFTPRDATYTAKNVAAIEVVIDLTRNNEVPKPETKPRRLMEGTDGTVLNKCDKAQNCIQVRIAIPIDLPYAKKRALLNPIRIRKVFSAKLSNPVDLEYQIQSVLLTEGMVTNVTTAPLAPTTPKLTTKKNCTKPSYVTAQTTNQTTKMTRAIPTASSTPDTSKTETLMIKAKVKSPFIFTFTPNLEDKNASDLLSPGMYLLVNKHPNGAISLKQISRNKINLQTEMVENTTPNLKKDKFIEIQLNDKKIILSEDFIDTINDHLRLLCKNLTSANQNAKCFEKRHIVRSNNTAWAALKKYFGHDKVCKGKCRANATLCDVCAASEEVVNELSSEFENLAQYMNVHCTELQTFFYMNPKAGKKLRDMVHKIDKNLNDYYKRIKGKCRGKSCETFTTFIDKRFDKDIETGSSDNANNVTDDSNNIHYFNTLSLEKAMEKENYFVQSLEKCLPENKRSARQAKNVKNVYSLDNINVNIICDPETTKLEPIYYDSTDPYADVDPNPNLALYLDTTTKETKKKSKKNIFTYYIKGHKNKRDSDNDSLLEPGGSSWDDYSLPGTLDDNEPTVKPRQAHKTKNNTLIDRLWFFSHPKNNKKTKRSKIVNRIWDSTIRKSSHKTTNEKSFVGRIWEYPITTIDSIAATSDNWMSTAKEKRNTSNMIDSMSMHVQKLIKHLTSGNTGHTTPQYVNRDNPYRALFNIETTSKEFEELKNKSKKNIFPYYVERHKGKRDSSEPPLLSDAGGSFWKDYIIRGTRDGNNYKTTKNAKSKTTDSKTTHKKASKKSLIDKMWDYDHKSHKKIGNKSSEDKMWDAKNSRKHNATHKSVQWTSSEADVSNSSKSEDSLSMHLQQLMDLYGSENNVRKYKEAGSIYTKSANNDIIFLTTKVYLMKNFEETQELTTSTESYSCSDAEEPNAKNVSENAKSEKCTKGTTPMTKEYVVVSKSSNSKGKVTKKPSFFNKMKKAHIFSNLFMDNTTPTASRVMPDDVDLSHVLPTFVRINKTTVLGLSSTCPTIIIIENIRKKKRIGKRKVRNRFKRHFHSEFKSS